MAAAAKGEGRFQLTAAPAALAREVTNSIGMKLVLIPKGQFLMGFHCLRDHAGIRKRPVAAEHDLLGRSHAGQALYRLRRRRKRIVEPEALEQPQFVNLLPLLPLTKNGQNRETVDRMLSKIRAALQDT